MDDDFDDCLLEAATHADNYLNGVQPKPKHIECLQTKFGHNGFRPRQWDIIRTIINDKRDNSVIMPTGYGKSLLFQYPSVFTNGTTLVVSPLISLMQDQVRSLSVANIPACFLGSAQTERNMDTRAIAGEFRLVYVSPEYIANSPHFLKSMEPRLTLIAVDEAHCVSQWGHDFRADYRRLDVIRQTLPTIPILSVTATATAHVQDDIIRSLNLKNPQCVNMGFDRPNIHFTFKPKSDDIWGDLKPFTTLLKGSTIIYVLKKAVSEEIAKILRRHGVSCEIYHAGLPLSKRKTVLNDFTKDLLNVIVATVAFGMGIDKPDVRTIVHYGASKNIETYYQEVGRAGRDGGPSHAITYFDKDDFALHEWFLNENHDHKSMDTIQHLRSIGLKMREFCYTTGCRRKCLLEYFGSDTSTVQPRKNCCDNCDRGSSSIKLSDQYENLDDNGNYDFTTTAHLFLKALTITSKTSVAIGVLRGSAEQKAMKYKNDREVYGAGKIWSKEYWTTLIQQLKSNDYLTMKPLPPPYRSITIISQKGTNWLYSTKREPLIMKAIPEIYKFFVKKRYTSNQLNINVVPLEKTPTETTPIDEVLQVEEKRVIEVNNNYLLDNGMNDTHLEEILMSVRKAMAQQNDCMPFSVASNMAITQMVTAKPVSIVEFKAHLIDGFSLAKIEKFATPFINAIVMFRNNDFCLQKLLSTFPLKKTPTQFTVQDRLKLLKLIENHQSFETIQRESDIPEPVLMNEIVNFLRLGFALTKVHLFHLVHIDGQNLAFIKENATDNDLNQLDDIAAIRGKFCDHTKTTDRMLILSLQYLKVRNFLKIIKVPFFDVDWNEFVNVEYLIKEKEPVSFSSPSMMSAIDRLSSVTMTSTVPQFSIANSELLTPSTSSISNEKIHAFEYKPLSDNKIPSQPSKQSQPANPVKSLQSTGWIETKPSKRMAVKSTSKVQYLSDSDDEMNAPAEKRKSSQPTNAQRALPQWISTKSSHGSKPKSNSRR